jgi:hypothetical protein
VDTDWPRDVFDRLLAHVIETKTELIAHLIVHDARNHDAPGIGQRLQPGRHIDAVTEDVIPIDYDVADVDATEFVRLSAGTLDCAQPYP